MNLKITSADVPEKILIIRLSSIGDILLSTPFIRQVRTTYPRAQIDFIVKDIYKDLLLYNPHINKLYTLKLNKGREELYNLKSILKENAYSVILDLHNNLRSNFLKHGIGAGKSYSIKKEKLRQILLVRFKINIYEKEIPIPCRYLSVGQEIGIEDDGQGLEIYLNNDSIASAEKKVSSLGFKLNDRFICLAPGAGFFTKRWPSERFKNLVDLIQGKTNYQIILLGDEKDKAIGFSIKKNKNIIDSCGKLSLLETAYVISKAKMIVSNDSGLMHIATAVQTPVVAIFGSTVKELGFFPYRSESLVVENLELSCRPCSHIGRNTCPKDHFKCMNEISAEQVYEEIKKYL